MQACIQWDAADIRNNKYVFDQTELSSSPDNRRLHADAFALQKKPQRREPEQLVRLRVKQSHLDAAFAQHLRLRFRAQG